MLFGIESVVRLKQHVSHLASTFWNICALVQVLTRFFPCYIKINRYVLFWYGRKYNKNRIWLWNESTRLIMIIYDNHITDIPKSRLYVRFLD